MTMMHDRSKGGRCHVMGHGSNCVLSSEIHEDTRDRAFEKREAEKEIDRQLDDRLQEQ